VDFEDGLAATVSWYLENAWWWRPIKDADPAYRFYYESQYGSRKP
jgi:dTDP-D-glucose 4,6-dehydratase